MTEWWRGGSLEGLDQGREGGLIRTAPVMSRCVRDGGGVGKALSWRGRRRVGGGSQPVSQRRPPLRPPDTVSCSPWGIFLLGAWGFPPQFQNPGKGAN